jgi:hypothetical protein
MMGITHWRASWRTSLGFEVETSTWIKQGDCSSTNNEIAGSLSLHLR